MLQHAACSMSGANKRCTTLKRQAYVSPQLLRPVAFLGLLPSQVWILTLLNTKMQLQCQPGYHITWHAHTYPHNMLLWVRGGREP